MHACGAHTTIAGRARTIRHCCTREGGSNAAATPLTAPGTASFPVAAGAERLTRPAPTVVDQAELPVVASARSRTSAGSLGGECSGGDPGVWSRL